MRSGAGRLKLPANLAPGSHVMIFDELSFKSLIRPVVDFPKPGVVFRDITPLFQSPRQPAW
ncbi:hypothetical protein PSCICE_39830 [Pseudomonas cichorii]|nr:hypothetical protein PSCICE_39830 [Pseudomonas cichorii]